MEAERRGGIEPEPAAERPYTWARTRLAPGTDPQRAPLPTANGVGREVAVRIAVDRDAAGEGGRVFDNAAATAFRTAAATAADGENVDNLVFGKRECSVIGKCMDGDSVVVKQRLRSARSIQRMVSDQIGRPFLPKLSSGTARKR